MKNKLHGIIQRVLGLKGNENFYLPYPISVRLSDMDFHILEIHGLCVSLKGELFIQDREENWRPLTVEDQYAGTILPAILLRLQAITQKGTISGKEKVS